MRWHEPQATRVSGPPVTALGAGGCSSGNQSGGALPVIFLASYSLALPGARMVPSTFTAESWTLSGMLNVQAGSPAGTVSSACAPTFPTISTGERAHTRAAIRTEFRRITASPLLD